MRVIHPADIAGTHRDRMVADGNAHAMCYLAEEDGCGFSFSTLTIDGDSKGFPLHYRNHIEANMILEGEGEIHNLETDERWPAGPGTLYVVGPADRHEIFLKGPVKVVSLFNPPIKGTEHHKISAAIRRRAKFRPIGGLQVVHQPAGACSSNSEARFRW